MTGNLRLLLVMFLWAICFPLITTGIQYAPHLTFAAMRAFLAGGALLAVALVLGRRMPHGVKDWLALSAIGFGATTLAFFGMFHAAEFVSPGIATVIASTQPLMAALLAHWFLAERLSIRGKAGLFLGFLGIVLISVPQLVTGAGDAFRIGIAYIVVSAIGITVSNIVIKRIAIRIDPLMAMGWQLVIGAIPLTVIAVAMEDPTAVRWTAEFLGSLVVLSIAGTALAYWLWYEVLKSVKLSHANAYTFLVPVIGLGIGVSFYQEQLPAIAIAGIALTLIGIYQVAKGIDFQPAGKGGRNRNQE